MKELLKMYKENQIKLGNTIMKKLQNSLSEQTLSLTKPLSYVPVINDVLLIVLHTIVVKRVKVW